MGKVAKIIELKIGYSFTSTTVCMYRERGTLKSVLAKHRIKELHAGYISLPLLSPPSIPAYPT